MVVYGNCEFVNIGYKPKSTDVVLEYRVVPKEGVPLEMVAEYVAGESSIGTWTKIYTMNKNIALKLKPNVFSIDKKNGILKIAYPEELFEPGNVPGLLSSIAGNIYGMKEIARLKLLDIHLTKKLVRSFRGPQFGIDGIKKMFGKEYKNRPLIGTIVKPKVGLTSEQHAKVAYEAWVGGLDLVKDDENLTSMSFNPFDRRAKLTIEAMKKAEKETGLKKVYLCNVTAETNEMLRRASLIKELGGNYVMVDILTVGWAGVQTLREHCQKLGLPLHGHRAMHGALTRIPDHGMSMLAIAKIARLVGIDTLHIGTAAIGKMHGSSDEELRVEREIESQFFKGDNISLDQDYFGLKKTLAVASGGLQPGMIPKLMNVMGKDIVMQFGGGCHGHPEGTRAGAKAIRDALDATMKGMTLQEYSKFSPELFKALAKWGEVK